MTIEEKKRTRRDPETARALILDAAERVFADRGPDVAGLKDVAKAAGVSHALISHYFGSYEALVEETLARRVARVREGILRTLAEAPEGDAAERLLDRVASMAEDRVTTRLMGWAFLTKRAKRADFFSARDKGLANVVDAVQAKRAAQGMSPRTREEVELAVVSALTMVMGFGLAREALLGGLGYAASSSDAKRFEARYRDHVKRMVVASLK